MQAAGDAPTLRVHRLGHEPVLLALDRPGRPQQAAGKEHLDHHESQGAQESYEQRELTTVHACIRDATVTKVGLEEQRRAVLGTYRRVDLEHSWVRLVPVLGCHHV